MPDQGRRLKLTPGADQAYLDHGAASLGLSDLLARGSEGAAS
jgi:hypothetical protein